jgi:hypothetical protein
VQTSPGKIEEIEEAGKIKIHTYFRLSYFMEADGSGTLGPSHLLKHVRATCFFTFGAAG